MSHFLPRIHSKGAPCGFVRLVALALIVSLALPLPALSATQRPRSVPEALLNGVTGFLGLPGGMYDPYNPNADQGLGFHQDGTARRADGTTGSGVSGANFDGRRAASYMAGGLGYGQGYGTAGSGYYGVGYDRMSGQNWRLGDSTGAAWQARQGGNSGVMDFSDPQRHFAQSGLNYGVGLLNSLGESAFTGLLDQGRIRLNFMINTDGKVNGEGDALFPFYDSQYTTIFTQFGVRSMSGMEEGGEDGRGADRWIGNFGLGQRWYPSASTGADGKVDSGNWMVGYNAFFDNDFSRSHQRGGVGLEARYDWLSLASNYYFPLSGWKSSYDFDGNFMEERPAAGWDVRLKGALPFYRNLAVTGAYSQWYGDHVGMFSSTDLERDPRVWSYGLEYTPVPLVSAFLNQRNTERGNSDTEFGLRFTYHFGMSQKDQTSHARVAGLRNVAASRHEFVDRENRIILEQRAKHSFHIEYIGIAGSSEFIFRIVDSFGNFMAGQTVVVRADGVTLAAAPAPEKTFLARAGEFMGDLFFASTAYAAEVSKSYVSDANGRFIVRVTGVDGPVTLHIAGLDIEQDFTVDAVANPLSFTTEAALTDATVGVLYNSNALSAVGGTAPYTYAVTEGALPAGLSFNVRRVAGTPTTAGDSAFTVTVTDDTGATASKEFTLKVLPPGPLSITTPEALPNATVGTNYNRVLAASGGMGPYTYAVSAGSLPAGLTLSGSVISGTPTAGGESTFTVTVEDSLGATVDKEFTLTAVVAPLSITTAAALPDAVVGVNYGRPLAVSGGIAPYSYAVTAGSIPPGMNWINNGAYITGSATTAGDYTFTVQVTDSASATASRQFSLTVNAPSPYTMPGPIEVVTNNSPADGVTANVLRVQIYDNSAEANAGAGVAVTWNLIIPDSNVTLVGGATSVTNAQGVAEMRITDSGGDANPMVLIVAVVGGGGAGTSQNVVVSFVAD